MPGLRIYNAELPSVLRYHPPFSRKAIVKPVVNEKLMVKVPLPHTSCRKCQLLFSCSPLRSLFLCRWSLCATGVDGVHGSDSGGAVQERDQQRLGREGPGSVHGRGQFMLKSKEQTESTGSPFGGKRRET